MLKPRRLLLIINTLLFITFTNSALAQTEIKNPLKTSYQSFVPNNWKILEKVQGDLNQDGQADIALIIEDTNPDHFVANAGLGSNVLNVNERKLLVLFKQPNGYQLIASNHSLPTEGILLVWLTHSVNLKL